MDNLVGDRLKLVRNVLRTESQMQFAETLGVPQSTFSRYERGATDVPDEIKRKIAEFGVNLHWLITGDGSMLLTGTRKETIGDIAETQLGTVENHITIKKSQNVENVGNILYLPEEQTVQRLPAGETHAADSLTVFEIPLLTKEQVLHFDPQKEIPQPKAHSGEYPVHTRVPMPLRFKEYGTDLRAMVVFNSFMAPLLNAGDVAIFQATGWNGNGVYVYRIRGNLYISHVHLNSGTFMLTHEFKPEPEVSYDETFSAIGRVRAVVREIG
jgi:transcriptional regulator with XRE-family HTH domain